MCTCRWVSFDIAKWLLDKKSYVVLSDFATLQHEMASLPNLIEDKIENENESFPDESNDLRIDADEEMSEVAFEDSDNESGPETTSLTPA